MQPRSSAYDAQLNLALVFLRLHARRFDRGYGRSKSWQPWSTRRGAAEPKACRSRRYSLRGLALRLCMAVPLSHASPVGGSWSVILVLYSPVIVRIALGLCM